MLITLFLVLLFCGCDAPSSQIDGYEPEAENLKLLNLTIAEVEGKTAIDKISKQNDGFATYYSDIMKKLGYQKRVQDGGETPIAVSGRGVVVILQQEGRALGKASVKALRYDRGLDKVVGYEEYVLFTDAAVSDFEKLQRVYSDLQTKYSLTATSGIKEVGEKMFGSAPEGEAKAYFTTPYLLDEYAGKPYETLEMGSEVFQYEEYMHMELQINKLGSDLLLQLKYFPAFQLTG